MERIARLLIPIGLFLVIYCADREPPHVEITNPKDGSYLNGTVLVTAEAEDNERVDSIKIFIDDSCIARFPKSYAYYLWNTETLLHNSLHYISAVAIDPSMNIGTDTVSVIVQYFGSLKWRYRYETQWDTFGNFLSSVAIGMDGIIYYGATGTSSPIPPSGYCIAINSNGGLKWTCFTNDWNAAPAIGSDGTVYVACCSGSYIGGRIKAIAPSGIEKWVYTTNDNIASEPAVAQDGTIYAGDYGGYLHALNPDGTLKWQYHVGGPIVTSPSVASNGTIYFGANDSYFYALNPDGTLKWRYQLTGKVSSAPSINIDGTIYFGTTDYYLYALDSEGTLKWRYKTSGEIQSSPAIDLDGTIYFGSSGYDYNFYAINPDGSLRWRFKTGNAIKSSPAISSDGTIYFGSDDGFLYALNKDGSLKWNFKAGGEITSSPGIGSDGTVYFTCEDGYLYALYGSAPLANTPWPKFRHDLKNTGRVGGN